uniref:AHNAK nucleoprotein n=1 Tax=Fundulus heteroclitus TaxID=8078 RepID=A0A3Q2R0Z8_FUNHE
MPKVNFPESEVKLKGPDFKGKKIEMPDIDISLPKGKSDGEIDGHGWKGGKFHMPSVDFSLPKIKAKGPEVNIEGPELKQGNINMPDVDISLQNRNVDVDFNAESTEIKGGKFKMPKFDISLPKTNLTGGHVDAPKDNISLPKVKGDVDVDGCLDKEGKFQLPSVDVSLPKIEAKGADIHIKGPELKSDIAQPKGKVEGDLSFEGPHLKGQTINLPTGDISFSKGTTDADFDVDGKFKMPKFDLSLPKVSLPKGETKDLSIKGGKIEIGPDASGDLEIMGLQGDIKPDQLKVKTGDLEGPGASLKLPSVKLPTVDISAPKLDLDFGLNKPQSDDVELLKAEGGRPSSGGSFDLPNVSLKAPSFTFPRFGSKSKSGDLEASGLQADISLHPPNVEGEIRAPSVEFDGDGKVKIKKHKIKMPSFGISKKDTDVSVSCPDVDVKMKKGKPDFPHLDFMTDNPDNKAKHKIKFPKFKMSSPKVHLPEGEVDAKVEADMDRKSGFHAPDVTLKFPKFSIPGFGSKEKDLSKPSGELQLQPKVKVPSVELSLPEAKTPEMEVLLPKAEVDVSEADIKGYEGNLKIPKMPKIDVSIPQVDLDVSLPKGKCQKIGRPDMELEGGEGKFKMPQITMPTIDVTLPKGKPKDLTKPKTEIDADGGKFTIPYVKMPTVDITLPKPDISLSKAEAPEIKIEGTTEQKFKMPRVDISLPKGKFQDNETPEMNERGKIKMPHIKMPSVDVTLPKGQIEGPDVEIRGEGGKFKMPQVSMPSVDISCSKGKAEGPNVQVEGNSGDKFKLHHCKMPDVDVSLPKGQTEAPGVEIKGEKGTYKMPQISMPSIQISLPKGKAEDLDIEVPNVEFAGEGGKFKMPHISMPSGDGSLTKVQFESPEIETGGGTEGKVNMPHLKMPNVDISLAKGNAGKIEGTVFKGEGHIPEVPSGDISVQKGKTAGPIPGIKSEGGKFKMPKVDITLPRGKPSVETPEVDIKKEGLLEMPKASTDKPIKGPREDIDVDIGFQREEGMMNKKKVVLPDLDLNTSGTETKVKRGKGKKFKIGVPKMKGAEDVTAEAKQCGDINVKHNDHSTDKGHINVTAPEVTLPSVCLKTDAGSKGGQSPSSYEIKVPRIPDIEFDIGTSQDEDDDKTETEKKVKIPKFGVPLPSMSSPERRVDIYGSEVRYEGPKMPKVKKAVFVLVNPNETEQVAASTTLQKQEPTAGSETEDVKVKMGKVKTKSNFGKSKDKSTEGEAEEEEKSKGAKIKMPKFSLSSGKSGSVDVTVKGDGSSSSLNGEKDATPHKDSKDDKGTFGGKIKLPKVEFTRPYSKMATGDKMGKDSSSGEVKGDVQGLETPDKMASTEVVSSRARTEMLDRDSSESPAGFSTDFTSTKVHMWSEGGSRGGEAEEKESTSWFKVPKFTLKPHTTGKDRPVFKKIHHKLSFGVLQQLIPLSFICLVLPQTKFLFNPDFFTYPSLLLFVSSPSRICSCLLLPTGFLQITPEGSPQAQRRGELGGEAEVSGSFCLHTSGVDFAGQQMSEEHQVSSTEEGSVTTVTKTTRITSHLVATETRTSESSSTTHQVLDFNY